MKRSFLAAYLLGLLVRTGSAQINDSVDINDVNALISADGMLFFDDTDPEGYIGHFYVPESSDPPLSSIFAASLWIGGIDDGEELHLAAQTYRQSGNDFWPGPVADDYSSSAYTDAYNNVWVVDKAAIDEHILNWSTMGYITPEAILNWPANGNTANGEAEYLAPFYDYNVNGIYDPAHGDYPLIRGDEALFFMFNDDAGPHEESGGSKLGVEVHGMAYAFSAAAEDTALNQTLFIHYEIFNRSENNYHDLYAGLKTDFDIGCYNDDWVGCDTSLNMFYGFNGDNSDDGCEAGYGMHPPAQGVVMLNDKLTSFMFYSNDFTVIGNPEAANDYYNYMKALWKDGTHLTYGGNGYGGTENTNYIFPSDPLDTGGWSELTESNPPADRRGVGSSGPYALAADASLCFDIALPFAQRDGLDTYQMISVLRERTQDIIDYYNENFSACAIENEENPDYVPDGVEQLVITGVSFYPNPVENYMVIEPGHDIKNGRLQILNAAGELMDNLDNINGHWIRLNNPGLAPGIYMFRLSDETFSGTGKFTVQ